MLIVLGTGVIIPLLVNFWIYNNLPDNGLNNITNPVIKQSDLDRKFFIRYQIDNSNTELQYCIFKLIKHERTNIAEQSFMEDFPDISMQTYIQTYRAISQEPTSDIISLVNPPSPFTEVIYRNRSGNPHTIPLVLRARLTTQLLRNGTRDTITKSCREHVRLMGQLINDDVGHLLANTLGGENYYFNFAPQTVRLNRHTTGEASFWLNEETSMMTFLKDNTSGNIEWSLTVVYPNSTHASPFRPVGFCLQHNDCDNQGNCKASPVMCFSNDYNRTCLFDIEQ